MIHVRADFRDGDEESNVQFSESGGSLNGADLFTELPFSVEILTNPSLCHDMFLECALCIGRLANVAA